MIEREKLVAMVRGLQNGDPDASSKLFETFQGDIYYFILKTVNNDRDLAEDLTQDTFMEILETIDKLQEPAAFVTWSKQIAYHKCTAYFRKRKELLVDENEDGYSVFDTVEEDREEFIPDAALDHEDLKQTIINMINDLPEEQKSAILLRYFNEISVKEIAEIQGVTEGTVKSRLNYGRKAIKQSVEEYEKKNDVKLHCAGVLPLMLWFFKNYRIKNDLHISSNTAIQEFVINEETVGAAAIIGVTASTTAATGTAAAMTAAATKTAVAVGGKLLTTKIIAGIAAVAVAIGGASIGIASAKSHDDSHDQAIFETVQENGYEMSATEVDEAFFATEEYKADAECEHNWSEYWVYADKECSELLYADRVCTICGLIEVVYEPKAYYTCEHEWVYESVLVNSELWKIRKCSLCQGYEVLSRGESSCDHIGELQDDYTMKCLYCGAYMGSYPYGGIVPEISKEDDNETACQHEMVMSKMTYGSDMVEELWACRKCGKTKLISYPNLQNRMCSHQGEIQPDFTVVCVLCGKVLDYTPPTQDDDKMPEEIPTEDPTEAPVEVPTEEIPTEDPTETTECRHVGEIESDFIMRCIYCGMPMGHYVADAECEHNMVMLDRFNGSKYINEWWECTKCGSTEFVAYPNPSAEVPTETPTEESTEPPTEAPTESPVEVPSEEPTESPVETPTEEPTEAPAEMPTEAPAEVPSEEPVVTPTDAPSDNPVDEPASAPSEESTEENVV